MTTHNGQPHGGTGRLRGRELGFNDDQILDLSASLHPDAPNISKVLFSVLNEVHFYPSDAEATIALARAIGVDSDRLLLTNGAADAIALLARHMRFGRIVEPEFSLYRRHLEKVGGQFPLWRSNPNNPVGLLASEHDVAAVWDESFFPIATGRWTRGDETSWRIGSLTKIWACPGLRLGYLIAPDAHSRDVLQSQRSRWSVNSFAVAVVEPMLEKTDLQQMHATLVSLRSALHLMLVEHGFDAHQTDANWVLVHNCSELRSFLESQAIFVRDCTNFGMPGTVRIAVPNENGLTRLNAVLKNFTVQGVMQ